MSYLRGAVVAPRTVSYPDSFDLRTSGRVSPVRDQLGLGACWAFAAVAAVESALLPGTSADFSEDNLALGAGFDLMEDPYNRGGNVWKSTAYFAGWAGPVLESQDAYGDGYVKRGLAPAAHVQEVLWVPGGTSGSDTANVKYALTEFGAVQTVIHWDAKYYAAGHVELLLLRGRAGQPRRDHLRLGRRVPGGELRQGASCRRRVAGEEQLGDLVGPERVLLGLLLRPLRGLGDAPMAAFSSVQPVDNYTGVYSYDPLGAIDRFGYALPKAWGANVFTARADQKVVALGFYTPVPWTEFSLYGGSSLTSLEQRGSGTSTMPGFHTVRFSKPLTVTAGAQFAVAVRLVTPGTDFPLSIEFAVPGYSSEAAAGPGQSYARNDDMSWEDLTDWNASANVCLKAYTGSADVGGAGDVTPPVTTASGVDDQWHNAPVEVKLTAGDPDPAPSGVSYTEYAVDDGAWTRGASVQIGADGAHTLHYRSADTAGNVEADRTCTVKIDTAGPVCSVRPASARKGGTARVLFRVDDALSPQVRYSVSVRSAGGAVKLKLSSPAWAAPGTWRTWSFPCTLSRGSYQLVVRARGPGRQRAKRAGRVYAARPVTPARGSRARRRALGAGLVGFVAVLAWCSFTVPAGATTLQRLTLAQLSDQAVSVVEGRVVAGASSARRPECAPS